jgi:hypothetical protein
MSLSLVEIGNDHVHAEGPAHEQVLGYGSQFVLGAGDQEEVGGWGDKLARHGHGDCRGGTKDKNAIRRIDRGTNQAP